MPRPLAHLRIPGAAALALLFLLATGCGEPAAESEEDPARPAAGKPSPPSHVIDVPVGRPVQLDGRMPPAEWEGAAQRPVGRNGGVLKVMQRDGMLLLGLDVPSPWPEGARLWLGFTPDEKDAGLYRPPAVRLDFEPRGHNRAHLMVYRVSEAGDLPVAGEAVARADVSGPRTTVEVALRLALLGVTASDPAPRRFVLLWMRGRGLETVSWPHGIRTEGPAGQPPPDLVSSAGWGLLRGWVNAHGPGAYARTVWEELLAEDAELARRGTAAHAMGLRIADASELPKRDGAVLAAMLENFRWIAEQEPLTPYDLFVLAKAYRHLNRKSDALAVLDALDAHPSWRGSDRLLYERALTLESAERYEEAATAWSTLAEKTKSSFAPRYEAMANRAKATWDAWNAEQAARAEDRARDDLPLVLLRTVRGDVVLQLFRDDVPESVEHFLDLVERHEGDRGFYDGTLFHRVVGDFLAQGGDPLSRDGDCEAAGSGSGPTSVNVQKNERHGFWRGAVGFARGSALVNGSQFFILTSPRRHLGEQDFTCFGHVIAGMDVVDRLEACDALLEARIISRGEVPRAPDEPEKDDE